MSFAAVLKGRPIELLSHVPIWQYVESKVKNFSSKVAQVSLIKCYVLYKFCNLIWTATRKNTEKVHSFLIS